MKIYLKQVILLAALLLTSWSWGQGFVLTSLQSNQSTYTSCDSVLSLSISALDYDTNSTADVDFYLGGTNFTASQFSVNVTWGDGSTTTHVGGVSNSQTAINFNPPLEHVYSTSGSYTVFLVVTNTLNNTYVIDTISFNDVVCNTSTFVVASLDCDDDGNVDSTITNGIPVYLVNNNYTFASVTNNGMAYFPNVFSGTYVLEVDQAWLAINGYIQTSIFANVINVYPGAGVTTVGVNLTCDSNTVAQSCISGYVFCDSDSNMVYSLGDIPLMNAPVNIQVNGQMITTYTSMNGYYSTVLSANSGVPAIISINPNWLAVNGYSSNFGLQTFLTSDCNMYDTINIPVNCNNACSNSSCAGLFVFCDANTNGIMDAGDTPIPNAPVQFMLNTMYNLATVYTDSNGYAEYCSNYIPSQYILAQVNQYWMQQHGYTSNTGILTLLTSNNQTPAPGNYPINCGTSSQCADIWTTVTPWIGYYQGNTAYIKLNIGNYGPGTAYTYTVTMSFPAGVTPITSSISLPGYTISGNTITWNLTNMPAGYSNYDVIQFSVPTGLASGTPHYYTSTITATNNTTDCCQSNNNGNLLQLVGSSYDPNDKTVDHETNIDPTQTESLTYVVRFQNTGTAPAQNIYILDTLSANLDWATFELLETSHSMQVINLGNGVLRFDYPQIWLPDSTANEAESHGHLVYRIRENASNSVGSAISNTAHIYFDWNDAIVTNTTYNINATLGINEITADQVRMYPNPATDQVYIQAVSAMERVELVDLSGKTIVSKAIMDVQTSISLNGVEAGMYLIRITTPTGVVSKSFIKQ